MQSLLFMPCRPEDERKMKAIRLLWLAVFLLASASAALAQKAGEDSVPGQSSSAAVVFNEQGVKYVQASEYSKAIEVFRKAVRLKSDYAPALNNLGVTYGAAHRYRQLILCKRPFA
jgi:Flp pilus assembly protein TadD